MLFSSAVTADHSVKNIAKPGEPGHEEPFGDSLVNIHIKNQNNGYSPTEHRVIYNDEDYQFIFQVYAPMERGLRKSKLEVYWSNNRNGEIIYEIPRTYGFHFHDSWTKGSQGNVKGVFEKESIDLVYTVIKDFSPFSREIVSANVFDFELINEINLPENIQPWMMKDIDSDGYLELICVDMSIAYLFDDEIKLPHALVVFKKTNSVWTQINSVLYKKWDDELSNLAKEQIGIRKVSTCLSLMYSLYLHGESDYSIITEKILFDKTSYIDNKIPEIAHKSFEILKEYLTSK